MCVVLIQLRKQTIVCDFLIINSTKIILIFHDFNKFLMKYLANAKKKILEFPNNYSQNKFEQIWKVSSNSRICLSFSKLCVYTHTYKQLGSSIHTSPLG